MSIIYFSHSYRKVDAKIFGYFAELIKYKQLTIRLDPPSERVNSARLERQLKYCDGMIALLTWREEGVSQHILYEISLCLRSRKPVLVFIEDNLPNDLIPNWILQCRFSRRSFFRQLREHQHYINILDTYLGKNPPPKYQPFHRKKTCILTGTAELGGNIIDDLISAVSSYGYSVIELGEDFNVPIRDHWAYENICSADLSICFTDCKTFTHSYLLGAIHLAFIPTIVLATNTDYKYNSSIPRDYKPITIKRDSVEEIIDKVKTEIELCEEDFIALEDAKEIKVYIHELLRFSSSSGNYDEKTRQIIVEKVNIAEYIEEVENQHAGRDIIQGKNIYRPEKNANFLINSPSEDGFRVTEIIRLEVDKLDLDDKNKKKIDNYLENIKIELKDKNSDKESIAFCIKQISEIFKKNNTSDESLKYIGKLIDNIAILLGTDVSELGWTF